MPFCVNCGNTIADDATFCAACGQKTEAKKEQKNLFAMVDTTSEYTPEDVKKNKWLGALSYLGALWLVPFFVCRKKSAFARFHLKQGLALMVVNTVLGFICGICTGFIEAVYQIIEKIAGFNEILYGVYKFFSVGCNVLFAIPVCILLVFGLINILSGKAKTLPLVGKFKID